MTFTGTGNSEFSGSLWEVTSGFNAGYVTTQNSSVTGKIGDILDDSFFFDGDPQKLKVKGLTHGKKYVFALYSQAWGAEDRTCVLSCSDLSGSLTINQNHYNSLPGWIACRMYLHRKWNRKNSLSIPAQVPAGTCTHSTTVRHRFSTLPLQAWERKMLEHLPNLQGLLRVSVTIICLKPRPLLVVIVMSDIQTHRVWTLAHLKFLLRATDVTQTSVTLNGLELHRRCDLPNGTPFRKYGTACSFGWMVMIRTQMASPILLL